MLETSQAMIGRKFAPHTIMNNEDIDLDSMITIINSVVTETASEILGNWREKKKPMGGQTTVNKKAPIHYIISINDKVYRPL